MNTIVYELTVFDYGEEGWNQEPTRRILFAVELIAKRWVRMKYPDAKGIKWKKTYVQASSLTMSTKWMRVLVETKTGPKWVTKNVCKTLIIPESELFRLKEILAYGYVEDVP